MNILAKLEQLVDDLREATAAVPEEDLTLRDAFEELCQMILDEYITLEMKLIRASAGKVEVEWRLWDGAKHYKSTSLRLLMEEFRGTIVPRSSPESEVNEAFEAVNPTPF
jgi:hypothetical protein